MNREDAVNGIMRLRTFVDFLSSQGVEDKSDYRALIKGGTIDGFMNRIFGFGELPLNHKRPRISSLVSAHFHPELPLIGFNYTPAAHNTLHLMPESWTPALRLCRGIVFDRETGDLAALPFEKFFNHGEHPETSDLPPLSYTATEKHDGHLGIIFHYRDQLLITTRGDFLSPTSKIAAEMLHKCSWLVDWNKRLPTDVTMLVEIIHQQTKVLRDYGLEEKFVLIGCRRNPLVNPDLPIDYSYEDLGVLGAELGVEVTRALRGGNVNELLQEICSGVTNREGWVATLDDGRRAGCRVKFKYRNYIGEMVRRKLSLSYLMKRAVSGNLEKMLSTLPEEIYDEALKMLGRIGLVMFSPGAPKEKWRRLYDLLPEEDQTESFKSACRDFAKQFVRD